MVVMKANANSAAPYQVSSPRTVVLCWSTSLLVLVGLAMLLGGISTARSSPPEVAPTHANRTQAIAEETVAAGKTPWRRRARPKDAGLGKTGWSVIDTHKSWPVEPVSPAIASIDAVRLGGALIALCPKLKPPRAQQWASWMLEYARRFKVDPMLLGALVYQEGRCKLRSTDYGVGPTRIHADMHRHHWRSADMAYIYWLPTGASAQVKSSTTHWRRHALKLPEFRFNRWVAKKPQANLYFAAALLKVWADQCPHIDASHGVSVPHRSVAAHFVWGDRVVSSHEEDEILIARRRLIRHYTGVPSTLRGAFKGRALHSPLEGPPRKLTGAWHDPREGRRKHKGVDYSSNMAEPVLAIADGTVWIAGADLAERPTASYRPATAPRIPRATLGRAGLLVLLDHGDGLTSGYMHLLRYTVSTGETVKAGQVIGYVGRSGVKRSSAHLHFEIRVDRKRVDPVPLLGPLVIDPLQTKAGRWRKARWDKAKRLKAKETRRARARKRP